jgi:hypothetical protein
MTPMIVMCSPKRPGPVGISASDHEKLVCEKKKQATITAEVCRICDKIDTLSFEHIPPKVCGNNLPIIKCSFTNAIMSDRHHTVEPYCKGVGVPKGYDLLQYGNGAPTLCRSCNELTGANYVPAYLRLYNQATELLENNKKFTKLTVREPLCVFKEVMAMFCSVNDNIDPNVKEFILSHHQWNAAPKFPYSVYLYSTVESPRILPFGTAFGLPRSLVSEIAWKPFGWLLSYNPVALKSSNKSRLVDVTGWAYNPNMPTVKSFILSTDLPHCCQFDSNGWPDS